MIKSRLIELVETGSLIAPCFSKYSPQGSAGVINLPDNKVFSKAVGGSRVSGKGCQRGHRQEAENHKATCVVSRQSFSGPPGGRCPADAGLPCSFQHPCNPGFCEMEGGIGFLEPWGLLFIFLLLLLDLLRPHPENLDKGFTQLSKSVELSTLYLLTLTLDIIETENMGNFS